MEITWRVICGEGRGKNGGTGPGNKKHKWYVQNRQGEVKNSIGNVEAKELMCTTHGRELRGKNTGDGGVQGGGEQRGEKMGQL